MGAVGTTAAPVGYNVLGAPYPFAVGPTIRVVAWQVVAAVLGGTHGGHNGAVC